MNKLFWCSALAVVLAGPAAAQTPGGNLSLTMTDGRVTLIAEEVTVRQILAEWARVGETQIVNGDQMPGGPMTLELRDVPEAKALEIVLRAAAGYIVAPRLGGRTGPSAYERVLILATSNPPPVSSMPPPSFGPQPRPMPQPMLPPAVTGNPGEEPQPPNVEEPPNMPPDVTPPGMQQPGMQQPGMQPGEQPAPGPLTSPRPGPLPQPVPGPVNPFQPGVRPGGQGGPGGPPNPNRPGGGGPDR